MQKILVVPGTSTIDLRLVESVAAEFGWGVTVAEQFCEAQLCRDAVAVLLHRDALGSRCSWMDAIQQVRLALPETRVVPCLGFAESIDWQHLSDAGAFHALWLPLKENEVRQSLGFLSASLQNKPALVSGSGASGSAQ